MVENLKEILAMHLEWWKSNFWKGRQAGKPELQKEVMDITPQ